MICGRRNKSMGLTFLTGYVLGQHGTQSARLASLTANRSGSDTNDLLELHDRVDRLLLVIDGIWSLLEDAGYTDDQLRERIREIDLADGTEDGRRTQMAAQCVGCDAKVAPGLASCQFCGVAVPADSQDPLSGV
jgi:hypothetical protein